MIIMRKLAVSQCDLSRIIEMAWEDRTPFEAISFEFGLSEGEVIKVMQNSLKKSSFKLWRERVAGRKTKHFSLRDIEKSPAFKKGSTNFYIIFFISILNLFNSF